MLTTPYARSLAHARGGSQDEEKNLLLPPFTPRPYYLGYRDYIILFGIYMSFSRFQYELLVHTPNTDVYRRILECRFTHFAPYVALSLAHVVDVQQFIRSHIARTIYTALPLLLDFPKRRRANRKVNILEMPSARFIGERVVVVLVVRTSGSYCTRKKATRCMFCVAVSSYMTC